MIELFLLVLASLTGEPELYDHVYSEHTVYFDKEGQHSVTLKIVDKICGGGNCVSGFYAQTGEMLIVQDKFGYAVNLDMREYFQGCTTYMHERYHALHGDWLHHTMPYGCEGVW